MLNRLLKLPETKKIQSLDDPSMTILHQKIIQKKVFLRKIYLDFYQQLKKAVDPCKDKLLVEIGSGGGFIKKVIPEVITSDVIKLPGVDKHFSALKMPFKKNSVNAFLMVDVFHHLGDISLFLKEVNRCLKIGGKIVMIEPANTLWARFIWRNFHHEPFEPSAGWHLKGKGPLSSANGALPWIIFYRDRKKFEKKFPFLKILNLKPHTPLRYLLSGGVSFRQLAPSFSYDLIKGLETLLSPLNRYLGMFLTIEIEKISRHEAFFKN